MESFNFRIKPVSPEKERKRQYYIHRLRDRIRDKAGMLSVLVNGSTGVEEGVKSRIMEYHYYTYIKPSPYHNQAMVNRIKRAAFWSLIDYFKHRLDRFDLPRYHWIDIYLLAENEIKGVLEAVVKEVYDRIYREKFGPSNDDIMEKPENKLSIDEIDLKIKTLVEKNAFVEV